MLYFTSIDEGKTWVGCRSRHLYNVKQIAQGQPWVTPDKVVYIGEAEKLGGPVKIVLAGVMRKQRRTWYKVNTVLPQSYVVTAVKTVTPVQPPQRE